MRTKNRFLLKEITWVRIREAIIRRIVDIPDMVAWFHNSTFSKDNKARLARFADIHLGERCFIMGNGPSLAKMDISVLKNEVTFGMNRIYLHFDRMSFIPTYYVAINELVLEQFQSDIQSLRMMKFLNWNRRYLYTATDSRVSFVRIKYGFGDVFSRDISRPISGGGTVTYVAMQIAFHMGFQEVILIGIDHSYTQKGTPNTTEVRRAEQDNDHFHPGYFPKGVQWQLPDLRRSEFAYNLARREFEAEGCKLLDATVGGKCQVFNKVNFCDLF